MTTPEAIWNAKSETARAAMLRANGITVSSKDTLTTVEYLLLPLRVRMAVEYDLEQAAKVSIPARFTDPAYAKAERKVARVERSIRRNVR